MKMDGKLMEGLETHDKGMMGHDEVGIADIKNAFCEDFPDEILDANKYMNMAKTAEEMGHMELAKGLYMIAYDEYTHAKFIHEHLVDWGITIPSEEKSDWYELKERAGRIFRTKEV